MHQRSGLILQLASWPPDLVAGVCTCIFPVRMRAFLQCRDGWYLLGGDCVASCPAQFAASGIGQFKRRCAEPFVCRSGRLSVDPPVNYGCKCATEGNTAIADCQICECGNFDIILTVSCTFLSYTSPHTRRLLSVHADPVLVGAWTPMLFPNWDFRHRAGEYGQHCLRCNNGMLDFDRHFNSPFLLHSQCHVVLHNTTFESPPF